MILFADAGFKGKNKVINGEVSHIGSDFNDKVRSAFAVVGDAKCAYVPLPRLRSAPS